MPYRNDRNLGTECLADADSDDPETVLLQGQIRDLQRQIEKKKLKQKLNLLERQLADSDTDPESKNPARRIDSVIHCGDSAEKRKPAIEENAIVESTLGSDRQSPNLVKKKDSNNNRFDFHNTATTTATANYPVFFPVETPTVENSNLPFHERIVTHKESILDSSLIRRTTNFKDPTQKPQETSNPRHSDAEDASIECYSGLRLLNRQISNKSFRNLMRNRQYLAISSLKPGITDADIPGDWVKTALCKVTIGVIVDKLPVRTSANQKKYIVYKIGDLNGCIINAFFFGHSFDTWATETVGSVFAILNPRILPITERSSLVGIDVNDPGKFMKLGNCMDYALCKYTAPLKAKNATISSTNAKQCSIAVDGRKRKYCLFHMELMFKKSKNSRAEFASGTGSTQFGTPAEKKALASGSENGSYLWNNGITISTMGQKPNIFKTGPAGERLATPLTKEEEIMIQQDTKGAKYVRALRNIPHGNKKKAGGGGIKADISRLFSDDALHKLGFDPRTGKDVIIAAPTPPSAAAALSPLPDKKAVVLGVINHEKMKACLANGMAIGKDVFGIEDFEIDLE
ncbi:minichromosome maintenance- protein [Physocladia obscura]|uniref:Minichromosome maintenance- protein n=1 Tax=Physocladia obscura TaxID=109957 RepID=A0AAD5T103_9FUNG|nr:minichromosome maintenance- protein [Physocladia obscura]